MKKLLFSLLVIPMLFTATPAMAEVGGTITKSIVSPMEQLEMVINRIMTIVLESTDWTNDDGTISFADNRYSVQYACNTFSGEYQMDGRKIELGEAAVTLMACDEDAMAQDDALGKDLHRITHLTFAAGGITLTGDQDAELRFTPAK